MLYLLDFIKAHENWEELLMKDPYNLKIQRDGKYIIFKYNQLCSDFSLPEVREARGIIFRESDWKCVCHAFDKFGNYGESYCPEIDWSTASVQEKVDGSLMKVWFDDTWHISTNGTIDAFKAPLACANKEIASYGDLFLYCLNTNKHPFSFKSFTSFLDKEYCYMFEMVSPYNRVVVEYNEPKLYYLGCRNLDLHFEESYTEFNPFENALGCLIDTPKTYPLHTLKEVQDAASILNSTGQVSDEGFVVCCAKYTENGSFLRVKIKSPDYVLAHRLTNNGVITWHKLFELILANETDEFIAYFPEVIDRVNEAKNSITTFKNEVNNLIKEINPDSFSSRKDYAMTVLTYPKKYQTFLFNYDKLDSYFARLTASKWLELLEYK